MKKVILSTVFALFAMTAFAGDVAIQPSQLPKNAQEFVSQYFPGTQIVAAQRDMDSFEAVLNNAVKIEFNTNGEWDSVKSYSVLPAGILPAPVEATVKQLGGQALEIDKDFGYYEVKLTNRIEAKIDFNGKVLKQEID